MTHKKFPASICVEVIPVSGISDSSSLTVTNNVFYNCGYGLLARESNDLCCKIGAIEVLPFTMPVPFLSLISTSLLFY